MDSWPAVLGALLMAWALGLQDLLTLSNVKTQQAVLGDWVSSEPVLSAIAFSLVYVLMTTFSVPGRANDAFSRRIIRLGCGCSAGVAQRQYWRACLRC